MRQDKRSYSALASNTDTHEGVLNSIRSIAIAPSKLQTPKLQTPQTTNHIQVAVLPRAPAGHHGLSFRANGHLILVILFW